MNVNLETLIPIGSILALNSALVGVLFVLAKSLRASTETNISLNSEMQEMVKDRQEVQRHVKQLADDLAATRLDFTRYKETSQQLITQLQAELANVKRALDAAKTEAAAMKESIRGLTKALIDAEKRTQALEQREQQLLTQLNEARDRIAQLEKAGRDKDQEIRLLTARVNDLEKDLKEAQNARAQLEREKAALEAMIAALTATTGEPGEHRPDEPEPTEEEPSEGV